MKIYKAIFIIIATVVLVSYLTINLYFHSDEPAYSGVITIDGITDTVEVYADEYGMPYVFAQNNKDLFFSAGYIVAKERLFQLSLIKAIINGNLADLLGEKFIRHDQYIQSKNRFLNKNHLVISEDYQALIESFCNGINVYMENSPNGLPISFKLAKAQPNKWSATDVIAALELMTNNYLADLNSHIINRAVNKYFGESRSFIFDIDTTNINSIPTLDELMLEYDIMNLIGTSGSLIGSKGFIVPAALASENRPIFIFNNNCGYSLPTKWFDIYLNSGDYNVNGSTIIGFPLPLVGNNETAVYALNGKTSEENINSIFDLAQNNLVNDNPSLFLVDTSGKYHSGSALSLYSNIESIDNLEVGDVIEKYHQNDNSKKADMLNHIMNNYIDLESEPELSKLNNWNGDESSTSKTAMLVNTIFKNLVKGIFKDELSLIDDNLFDLFLRNTKLVEYELENVIRDPESSWLDDINTINYTEELDDIINEAIDLSLTELKSRYGIIYYEWGKVNQPRFEHILQKKNTSKLFTDFDIKELPRNGSNERRNLQEFLYNENLTPVSISALTKIFDLSDLKVSYSRLIPGQSGNPSSSHYSDQIDLYANESFRRIMYDEDVIRSSNSFQHLILCPSE